MKEDDRKLKDEGEEEEVQAKQIRGMAKIDRKDEEEIDKGMGEYD